MCGSVRSSETSLVGDKFRVAGTIRNDPRCATDAVAMRRTPQAIGGAIVSNRRGLSRVIVPMAPSLTPASRRRGRNVSARYV